VRFPNLKFAYHLPEHSNKVYDAASRFLRNVGTHLPDYCVMSQNSVTLKEENFEDSFVKNGTLQCHSFSFFVRMYAGHPTTGGCTYVMEKWSKEMNPHLSQLE